MGFTVDELESRHRHLKGVQDIIDVITKDKDSITGILVAIEKNRKTEDSNIRDTEFSYQGGYNRCYGLAHRAVRYFDNQ